MIWIFIQCADPFGSDINIKQLDNLTRYKLVIQILCSNNHNIVGYFVAAQRQEVLDDRGDFGSDRFYLLVIKFCVQIITLFQHKDKKSWVIEGIASWGAFYNRGCAFT